MASVTLNAPELSGGSVSFEISAEALQLVQLSVNPKNYQSVFRFKILAAATITQLKLIPATTPPGNVNDAVLDVLASLADVVALAEASADF
jgi:hypothetical protein